MALLQTTICDFGWKAKNFSLLGVDGKTYSLADIRGPKGTLIMFICNHCPYVRAVVDRLVEEVRGLQQLGIGALGVMSNDTIAYPEDSFEKMKQFSREHKFSFPYVIDKSQEVARAYGAVCTPDFFGFNTEDELQYRGRFDESRKEVVKSARRDLYLAMKQVADTGHGPKDQIASMGCSIKWREA